MLIYERHRSITEISMNCGFSSLSYFTYSFTNYFKTSPKNWRNGAYLERFPREYANRKKSKVLSRKLKADEENESYNEFKWLDLKKVKVIRLPDAYTINRYHIGSYVEGIPEVWEGLYRWGKSREMISSSTLMIGIPRNNPYITPPEKSFYDCRLAVSAKGDEDEERFPFKGGRYVLVEFDEPVCYEDRGTLIECYSELYSYWLPQSGFRYLGNPIELIEMKEDEDHLTLQTRIYAIALPIEPD